MCRIILSDMVQATGAPELLLQFQLTPSMVVVEPQVLVPQLLALLAACPRPPLTDSQQIMPLDHFLHTELQGYRRLVDQVGGSTLGSIACGEIIRGLTSGSLSLGPTGYHCLQPPLLQFT